MKQPIICLFLLFFVNVFAMSQPVINEPELPAILKEEATAFSLSIVQLYFTEDCEKMVQVISDTVMTIEGEGVIATANKAEAICISVKKAVKNNEKTFDDYLETYKYEIFTRAELEEHFQVELPEYYTSTSSDFFFVGSQFKDENKAHTAKSDFIDDDMFVFMVRKEKQGWRLKGL